MINGTLLVQIIHFFCAYLIFKQVLLKKVLIIVEQQEAASFALNRSIVDLKKQITDALNHKDDLWGQCLQKINAARPRLETAKEGWPPQEPAAQQMVESSGEQKKDLVDSLAKRIVRGLAHTMEAGRD